MTPAQELTRLVNELKVLRSNARAPHAKQTLSEAIAIVEKDSAAPDFLAALKALQLQALQSQFERFAAPLVCRIVEVALAAIAKTKGKP